MLAFIRLTRPLNLLMVAFTMFAMRYWVIGSLISPFGFELQFSSVKFILLVFSVVCIAAAGNVINDYFDAKIDTINKPESVIVGFGVSRRVAMTAHFVFSLLGIAIGTYLAWSIGRLNLAGIHLFCAVTLWYYSSVFKRQLFLGNFVIALLAGLVPVIVALYELPLLAVHYSGFLEERFQDSGIDPGLYLKIIFYWILAFAVFAFLLNLIREIQKDLADMSGDRENGRETIPIIYGYTFTYIVITILTAITSGLLAWAYTRFIAHSFSLAYFIVLFGIPMAISLYFTWTAKNRKHYLIAGNLVKFVMVAGIAYSHMIAKLIGS
ncbi:MAG: geranylgeranylglycerol-phosphate geranylgeranyltransferase [Bacteroidota bacterium]